MAKSYELRRPLGESCSTVTSGLIHNGDCSLGAHVNATLRVGTETIGDRVYLDNRFSITWTQVE